MKKPLYLMIKPASGQCNLRCRYCFYLDEHTHKRSIMSLDTLEIIVKKAAEAAQGRLSFLFQGGEPLLAGLEFFQKLIKLQKQYARPGLLIENSIQTNGCLLNDEWASFFMKNKFLLGLSLDGPDWLHDLFRIGADGCGSHKQAMRAVRLLKKHNVEFNILSVLHAETAAHIKAVYSFFKKQDLPWQQYITCISEPGLRWTLSAQAYGECLCRLFDLWYQDITAGNFIYIRYFENLVGMIKGRAPENCGMAGICAPQIVIESDGSVYPCDFYVQDSLCIGNLLTDSFDEIEAARAKSGFIEESLKPSSICRNEDGGNCPWFALCRGGCRRDRDYGTALAHNRFCASYKQFFEYAYERLAAL